MILNHINIPVADVPATKDFFEQYLDLTCVEIKGKNDLAVLKGTDGFTLVLMTQAFNRSDVHEFPSAFHVGFLLPTKAEVTARYDQLASGGVGLQNKPASMRGVFGFYFIAPGNILVEISSDEAG